MAQEAAAADLVEQGTGVAWAAAGRENPWLGFLQSYTMWQKGKFFTIVLYIPALSPIIHHLWP